MSNENEDDIFLDTSAVIMSCTVPFHDSDTGFLAPIAANLAFGVLVLVLRRKPILWKARLIVMNRLTNKIINKLDVKCKIGVCIEKLCLILKFLLSFLIVYR